MAIRRDPRKRQSPAALPLIFFSQGMAWLGSNSIVDWRALRPFSIAIARLLHAGYLSPITVCRKTRGSADSEPSPPRFPSFGPRPSSCHLCAFAARPSCLGPADRSPAARSGLKKKLGLLHLSNGPTPSCNLVSCCSPAPAVVAAAVPAAAAAAAAPAAAVAVLVRFNPHGTDRYSIALPCLPPHIRTFDASSRPARGGPRFPDAALRLRLFHFSNSCDRWLPSLPVSSANKCVPSPPDGSVRRATAHTLPLASLMTSCVALALQQASIRTSFNPLDSGRFFANNL